MVFGVWCLVFGVWCLVFGVWCSAVCCLLFGVAGVACGVWCFGFSVSGLLHSIRRPYQNYYAPTVSPPNRLTNGAKKWAALLAKGNVERGLPRSMRECGNIPVVRGDEWECVLAADLLLGVTRECLLPGWIGGSAPNPRDEREVVICFWVLGCHRFQPSVRTQSPPASGVCSKDQI